MFRVFHQNQHCRQTSKQCRLSQRCGQQWRYRCPMSENQRITQFILSKGRSEIHRVNIADKTLSRSNRCAWCKIAVSPVLMHWRYCSLALTIELMPEMMQRKFTTKNTLIYVSENLSDDKSTLDQVMAWCHQTTVHSLSQC